MSPKKVVEKFKEAAAGSEPPRCNLLAFVSHRTEYVDFFLELLW